jgi:hypothetical protein
MVRQLWIPFCGIFFMNEYILTEFDRMPVIVCSREFSVWHSNFFRLKKWYNFDANKKRNTPSYS